MPLFKTPKAVLRFRHGAAGFLKDYASNVPEAPQNAFLDVKGNIVAVCDVSLVSPDEALGVVETPDIRDRLLKHLEKYRTFAGVEIVPENWRVYHDLKSSHPQRSDETLIPKGRGHILLTREPYPSEVDEVSYLLYRLKYRQPLQGVDFDDEMLLNVFPEGYVSYDKGCYLGQEIIARVHHRSKPPKKLIVKAEHDCSEDEKRRMTSKAFNPVLRETFGFVFV